MLVATLFLFAPAFPSIQGLIPNRVDTPEIPFHTSAYTEGRALPYRIEESTTVGPEDGIILINGAVIISQDATLTIKPGTTLAVAEYGEIRVQGNLEARGTEKNPIQFISNEKNQKNRNWNGILFEETGSGIVEYAVFHHASPSISCSQAETPTIRNNTYLFGNLELYGACSL